MNQAYQQLEQRLTAWSEVPHMVACNSGTAALHLAFETLCGDEPSREVLCPDYTMIACARAITLAGLTPIFVDCGKDLLLDLRRLRMACTPRTCGILAVHVYGRVCNMDAITALATERDLFVVEDLAEAHGVKPHAKTDAACWSFYKNKVIAGEEGGAVGFRMQDAAARAQCLRSLGFTEQHDFWHIPRGHNYRMSNAHAELILPSLRAFSQNLSRRGLLELEYDKHCLDTWKQPLRRVPWVYDVRIPDLKEKQQRAIVKALNKEGIQARMGFKPIRRQLEYAEAEHKRAQGRRTAWTGMIETEADKAGNEVFYLPLDPYQVTPTMITDSFRIIQDVLKQ